jgi:hypothetical protein
MKYLRALLGSLLLLSFIPFSQAQLVFSGSNWTIGTLNLADSTYQILGSPPASTPKRLYTDIAMTPDGRILASGGILSQADGINESYLIAINTHNVLESDTLFVLYGSQTGSLACDSAYNVYMGSGSLYSYNLLTEELTFLGTNPNGWNTGDIAWFDGQLYGSQISLFQTNGNPPPHFFRYDFDAVNIDQSASTTDEFPFFIGLSKVYDYQNERFRFIGNEAIRGCCEGVRDTSVLYEIFLEDTTYTELFRLALEPFDRYMTGLASSDEFRRNFSLQLDLDADDSSGRFIDHHQVDGLCTRTFRLADTDTRIRATAAGVDSLVVELALGVHPVGEELLSVTALPGFVVEGNGTTRIKVIPNDIADIENLELLISSFQLNVAGDTLRTGERRVDFFLYSQDQVSDGSMAFVYPQPDVVPYPGEDYALELCLQTTENLFVGLGEGVYTEGHWSPALGGSFDNYINPAARALVCITTLYRKVAVGQILLR